MADHNLPRVEPVRSPWRERLFEALAYVQHDLLMVGPYIKDDVIAMLKDTLAARSNPQPLSVRVITRALPDDFLSGASDIAALQHLLAWPAELAGTRIEVRIINNVHAKVWIFDADLAIVGSGNATLPGLEDNLEYSLAVAEPQLVEHILQDWQKWWEQASPVDAIELERLRQWLDAIASDEEVRSAEKAAREKRQAVERKIGAAPRIGKRLAIARSERQAKHAISEGQDLYGTSHLPIDFHEPELSPGTSHRLPEVVRMPASHLWQALRWAIPLTGSEPESHAASETFLKITTNPAPQQQQVLQCTWADGKRFSQATIQGYTGDAQPSWTITLGRSAVLQLVDYLQHVSGEIASDNQSPVEPELLVWWQPAPSHLFISQASESNVPAGIPCMPAAVPRNAPALRPPLSQITIEQESFLTGLMTLKQQWERLHPDAPALASLEISFGSLGETSTLILSVGPIEAPLTRSLPGTNCILSGPEIRLRLDFASVQHIVTNTQEVRRWRIRIGRDADAVQFIPKFDNGMAWAGSLTWVHELRDVAEG